MRKRTLPETCGLICLIICITLWLLSCIQVTDFAYYSIFQFFLCLLPFLMAVALFCLYASQLEKDVLDAPCPLESCHRRVLWVCVVLLASIMLEKIRFPHYDFAAGETLRFLGEFISKKYLIAPVCLLFAHYTGRGVRAALYGTKPQLFRLAPSVILLSFWSFHIFADLGIHVLLMIALSQIASLWLALLQANDDMDLSGEYFLLPIALFIGLWIRLLMYRPAMPPVQERFLRVMRYPRYPVSSATFLFAQAVCFLALIGLAVFFTCSRCSLRNRFVLIGKCALAALLFRVSGSIFWAMRTGEAPYLRTMDLVFDGFCLAVLLYAYAVSLSTATLAACYTFRYFPPEAFPLQLYCLEEDGSAGAPYTGQRKVSRVLAETASGDTTELAVSYRLCGVQKQFLFAPPEDEEDIFYPLEKKGGAWQSLKEPESLYNLIENSLTEPGEEE